MSENVPSDLGPLESAPSDLGPLEPAPADLGPLEQDTAAPVDAPIPDPFSVAAFLTEGVNGNDTKDAFAYTPPGLSPTWVAQDPKMVAAVKAAALRDQNAAALRRAPKLSELIARDMARIAPENVPDVSALEAGFLDLQHSYYARKNMDRGADPDASAAMADIERVLAKYDQKEHGLVADVARMIPTAAAYGVATIAGGIAAGPAAAGGALAAPFWLGYEQQAGDLYEKIQDRELAHIAADPNYQPLTPDQMRAFAKKGAIAGATFFTALGNTFTKALPGVNAALERLGINVIAESGGDTVVKAVIRRAEEIGAHTLSGSLAMAAQAASDDATVRKATEGQVDIGKAAAAGVQAFKAAFGPALALSSVSPLWALYGDVGRIRDAPVETAQLDHLVRVSGAVIDKLGDQAEPIIGHLAKDTDAATVYVNHEALTKNPEAMQAVADVVGDHAVAEAIATQGDVPVPIEKYLTKIAPDHHDALREDVKLSDDGYSLREASQAKPDPDAVLATLPEDQRASAEKILKPKRPEPAPTPADAMRDIATASMEGKRLGEIQPGRYAQDARRAENRLQEQTLKAAERAAKPGQEINATRAMVEVPQMTGARDFARALEKAARDVHAEADGIRRELLGYTKDDARADLGKAGPEYREQMDRLLSGIEFGNNASRTAVARRLATQAWLAGEEAAGRQPVIPDSVMEKLDRFVHWKELTPQELRDFRDAAKSIATQAELKNTLLTPQGRRDFVAAKAEAIDTARANMTAIPIFQSGDVIPIKESLARTGRGAEGIILKAEELVRRLDGGKIDGPWGRYFWHPLSEAFNRFLMTEERWSKPLHDAIEAVPKETRRKWKTETFMVEGRERTMEQALALALNQGNAGNAYKALKGLQNGKALGLANWTQATVDEFLSHVNRDGWDAAQRIGDALEAAWPEIAAHEERSTGLPPGKVKPRGFDLWFDKDGKSVPSGTEGAERVHYRGWYYPLIYERQFSFLGRFAQREGDLFSRNYRSATTPQGRLQSRIENYARPIDLTLERLPGVVREFAKDVEMREALVSAHRFITDPDIVNTLHQTIGEPNTRALQSTVMDAANSMVLPANGAEALLDMANKLRGGVSASVFSWNIAQTTQNLASLTQIGKHVPATYIREAIRQMTVDPSAAIDFARASSGEMSTRANHINADMTEAVRAIRNKNVLLSHLDTALAPAEYIAELGLKMFQSTDSFTAHLGWRSAYEHAIAPAEKGGLGLEHENAVRHADRVVRLGIGSGRTIDLPAFLRHPVLKLLAPFSGWSSTMLNDVLASDYNARKLFGQGDRAKAMQEWGGALLWGAALGIAGSLTVFRGPKDEKKDGMDAGDVARWLAVEGVLAPAWLTPYMGSGMKKVVEGEKMYSAPFTPTIGRPIETMMKASVQLSSKIHKDKAEIEDFEKFGLGALEALATAKGLPVVQTRSTLGYLFDDKSPKDNPLQIGLGVAAGKSAPGKLIELTK